MEGKAEDFGFQLRDQPASQHMGPFILNVCHISALVHSRCGRLAGRLSQPPAGGIGSEFPPPRCFGTFFKDEGAGNGSSSVTIQAQGGEICVLIVGSKSLRGGCSDNPIETNSP